MKLREGQWVKILVRRFESPDLEFVGKVTEINEEYVVAESMQARRSGTEPTQWAMEWDNPTGSVWISAMTRSDWAARNRRKHAGFRL